MSWNLRGKLPWMIAGGLVVVVVAALLSGGPRGTNSTAYAQAPAKPAKWEYCEIGIQETSDRSGMHYYFETGEKTIFENSFEALAKTMGAKEAGGYRAHIFDYLGAQGWELVLHYQIPKYSNGGRNINHEFYWTFKRLKP